jgi:hypothetical protein
MGPRNRFQGMYSASLCILAGRYDNLTRFLAPIDCFKIPALSSAFPVFPLTTLFDPLPKQLLFGFLTYGISEVELCSFRPVSTSNWLNFFFEVNKLSLGDLITYAYTLKAGSMFKCSCSINLWIVFKCLTRGHTLLYIFGCPSCLHMYQTAIKYNYISVFSMATHLSIRPPDAAI